MTDRDDDMAEVVLHPSARAMHGNAREAELDELPVRNERGAGVACRHNRTVVNFHARTLKCRDCKVDVDPLAAIHEIARDGEYWTARRQQLRRDVDYLTTRLEELRRDERNTKARIRTATRRASR